MLSMAIDTHYAAATAPKEPRGFTPMIEVTAENRRWSTSAIDIQIWKAGTIGNVSWCPIAGSEWCVDIFSPDDNQEVTAISGAGHTNTMQVSGYREGLELGGTSGAVADPMYFDYNQWESTRDNSWSYQGSNGTLDDPQPPMYPADVWWNIYPASPNSYGGDLQTCISGAGC